MTGFGYILNDRNQLGRFSSFVQEREATHKNDSNAPVGERVATFGLKGRAVLDRRVEDATDPIAVLGVDHGEHGFCRRNTLRGIQAVEAKELEGPIALPCFDVQFPATCLSDLLRVSQEGFALAQTELRGFARSNIASHEANGGGTFAGASYRVSQGMEPAAAGGKFDWEFAVQTKAVAE